MSNDIGIFLVVIGFGGVAIYFLTRPPAVPMLPPVLNTTSGGQCGASYVGIGASVPCTLLINGVKELGKDAYSVVKASGVPGEVKKATNGFGVADVVLAPVAATHAVYNEIKRLF